MWFENKVKIKKDRVVVKLYDDSEKFIKSIIIPTEYYPLPNNEIKYFSALNTTDIKDEKMIKIINSIEYKVGKCFENTSNLFKKLSPFYDVRMYAGWLFVENDTPVWHSWIVYNERHIIDLNNKNDKYEPNEYLKNNYTTVSSYEELVLKYYTEIKKLKNSETCFIGNVNKTFFYVGVECEAYKSKDFYNNLLDMFPNHETYANCDKSTGLNKTQQMLKDNAMF